MAIQYIDNFNAYGPGGGGYMLDGTPWSSLYAATVTDPDTGSSGTVLQVENWAIFAVPTPQATIGIGCRLYMFGLPSVVGRRPKLIYSNSGGTALYFFTVEPNGALSLYTGVGTLINTTTSPVLAARSWYHLETKLNVVTGAYEARIEGVNVLSGTIGSPVGGTTGIIGWYSEGVSISFCVKDWIVWDTTGSNNNNFLGSVAIYTLTPNSNVSSGWTKSSGTSDFDLVDESPPNDTDFISAGFGPFPAASFMGLTDLPSTIVSVLAVQVNTRAKKSDGGTATLVTSLKSGAFTTAGGSKNVTTAYKYWADVIELDPATGALWSPLAVNSAQIKLDRTV